MLKTPADTMMWSGAADIAAAVTSGRVSATSIVEAALLRIREREPLINSFTTITEDRALAAARNIDFAIAAGKSPGPLAGAPFAVKNLFDIAGITSWRRRSRAARR